MATTPHSERQLIQILTLTIDISQYKVLNKWNYLNRGIVDYELYWFFF